jgi:hypothetical protein
MHRQTVINLQNVLPLGLSDDGQMVNWRDVGECGFARSFFHTELESYEQLHSAGVDYETCRSFVEQSDTGIDTLQPTAFIFHMSRCGSTLLANVMAANERIVVMSEPPVISPLLRSLCNDKLRSSIVDPVLLQVLRNVVGALGRRRRQDQQYYMVKFNSWNVLQAQAIQLAFPGVPCLFLYREPAEVMVSLLRRPPGWMEKRTGAIAISLAGSALDTLLPVEYAGRILQGLVGAGLNIADACFMNYTELRRDVLPRLLQRLGIEVDAPVMANMQAQFERSAKSPWDVAFVDDRCAKQLAASGEIGEVSARLLGAQYAALENSTQNFRQSI